MREKKNDLPQDVKEFFKEANARRRARNIEQGELCIKMDASTIIGFSILWDSWVDVFGLERAQDLLIEAMTEEHFKILDRVRYQEGDSGPKRKRQKKARTAAPNIDHPVRDAANDEGSGSARPE